ncbi:MAG: hypothetical protein ACYCWN_12820 [Ferrimicrobium sp.]|uniref:Uncharacterized protein n=1 Tax=Ferrimicrobium acidiphilum TaxID=121039 RepID=A0ABV3Y0A6_9ACTN
METPHEAMTLAKGLLDGLKRRWPHALRIAARAEELAAIPF